MVEVIHKGKTTTWMTNIVMPILKEFNLTVKDWSWEPLLYDIWLFIDPRSRMSFWNSELDICQDILSFQVCLHHQVKQEGVHRNASCAENNIPNVPIVPEAPMHVSPKISDSLTHQIGSKWSAKELPRVRTRRTSLQR
jgi:hypothetical protein